MSLYDEIVVGPEISEEYQSFEEFCSENSGHELAYLDLVTKSPLQMDPVTLAFSMRHLVRLSRDLLDMLLESLKHENTPDISDVLGMKGIQLDKGQAQRLREIVFSYRDAEDEEVRPNFVKALQLMTISRERNKVTLNLGESYLPPDEGWNEDDFGGDDAALETIRSIEDPRWKDAEEHE
jgi:hypothetical protein